MKHLFLFFLLLTLSVSAQNGVITGKIVDSDDSFSLPGATVRLNYQNRYTISDQNGTFQFLDVPAGNYQVTVDYIGYQTATQPVVLKKGENTVVNFSLSAGNIDLQEVVVLGDNLRGQAKALNQQRNSNNITNIISADQVGRFPDSNIGDALKRVSGVTMQNDQGEARNIIIRGLAASLNSVSLNGDRIPSAEGDNRNVQMDLIPADMISSIEVNKTLTSDMDADAIGGSVNLVTRVSPNRERISATVAGGYLPIRDHGLYNVSFLYGNRYLDNKLGVSVSGSYQNKLYGSDNIEAVWAEGNNNQVYVSQFDIRKYDVQRLRRSVSANLDYEFNSNNRIAFKSIYNWRYDRENRYRLRYNRINPVYDAATGEITGFSGGRINRQTKGGIDDSRVKNTRLEDQRVFNFSLDGEHLLSSKVDLDWKLGYSKASEKRPNERYITYRQNNVTGTQDLSDTNFPLIIPANEDLGNSRFNELTEQFQDTHETELGARVNLRFPFSVLPDQKGRLRTGLRLRIKNKERDNILYEYTPATAFGRLDAMETSTFSGENWQPGEKYVPGTFVSREFLGSLQLKDAALFTEEALPEEYLAQNYKAKENISAVYVRWDQNLSDKTVMIFGVRVEHTSIDYTGNYMEAGTTLLGTVNRKNDYTNLLPSLTFKHSLSDDFILRAALTTALARPDYYKLTPYVNAITADERVIAGNPDLKATYAYNVDVMAEKYFRSIGMISGGVFYKRLDDFIFDYMSRTYTAANFAADYPNLANPIPVGDEWRFNQSRNGESVDVYGFEVAFQRKLDFLPSFLSNFSLYGNYTYTKSKAKGITNEDGDPRSGLGLPGTAPHMVNGSLAWENSKFSARTSLNFAADYLDTLGGSEFEDVYYDKQLFLDVNASYKITPQLRIFAEANNLTNQPLRYYQGTSNYMYQAEYYRPTYTLGLKFDF
ncbi:MAG: TonB-dependent receptor [Capnocytophaga sp.]|nr:TonB-dependent receptor [Capnocytophaga sp.]